jgi:hypothetical protein
LALALRHRLVGDFLRRIFDLALLHVAAVVEGIVGGRVGSEKHMIEYVIAYVRIP